MKVRCWVTLSKVTQLVNVATLLKQKRNHFIEIDSVVERKENS